jgi:hypothetical protein
MSNRFARRCAKERFGPNKVVRRDMLGAFLRHGMDPGEAERGGLLQLFVALISIRVKRMLIFRQSSWIRYCCYCASCYRSVDLFQSRRGEASPR